MGARCKGTILVHAKTFLEKRFGEGSWASFRAELAPDERETLGDVLSVGWYDEILFLRVLEWIERAHPDAAAIGELARFEADHDLTGVHRAFLRLANPGFVLEQAGNYWGRFHESGRWNVDRLGTNGARGDLYEWSLVDRRACEYVTAYTTRMFELVGARHVRVRHVDCRCRGQGYCRFEGRWD